MLDCEYVSHMTAVATAIGHFILTDIIRHQY